MNGIYLLIVYPDNLTTERTEFRRAKCETLDYSGDIPKRFDFYVVAYREPLFNYYCCTGGNISKDRAERLPCYDDKYCTRSDGGCAASTDVSAFNWAEYPPAHVCHHRHDYDAYDCHYYAKICFDLSQ